MQETLNLNELSGYSTGDTVHVVVNNQIGFTTPPSEGRSCACATDIARLLQIPIFHVNGENLASCCHGHPTLAEAAKEAAFAVANRAIHY